MGAASSNRNRKFTSVMSVHRKSTDSSAVAAAPSRTRAGGDCRHGRSRLVSHATWELTALPEALRRMPPSTIRRWRWLFLSACVSTSLLVVLFYWRISVFEMKNNSSSDYSPDFPRQQPEDRRQRESEKIIEDEDPDVHVNPHNYRYLINPKDACNVKRTTSAGKDVGDQRLDVDEGAPSSVAEEPPEVGVHLLIYVCSAINHTDRREAIRQTWGSKDSLQKLRVALVFLLGGVITERPQTENYLKNEEKISQESATYRDIVRENFVDSYYNLSLKAVMGLKWADRHCRTAAYVMKTDDDVFVNVETLLQLLPVRAELRRRRWIGGCIKQRRSPAPLDRNGQPLAMPPMGHPPFVAGAGYVISGDIVSELYRTTLATPIVPVEDAYVTAYCARSIGVRVQHYEGFNCGETVAHDCDMRTKFVGHHVTPERQHRIWKSLSENGRHCGT